MTADQQSHSNTALAIIGLGCLFPQAENSRAFWANIAEGLDGITDVPPTHWNPDDYHDPDPKARDRVYARRGGFLNPVDFNPLEFGIAPRDVEAIDTTQLLGLVAAKQALADAGYGDERSFDRSRVGVIMGVTGALEMVVSLGARMGHPIWRRALLEAGVAPDRAAEVVERISASYVEWQENSFPGLLGNVAAGRIANRLDLGGTNCVVDAACASSLAAIHLAGLELADRRADLVVTGGLDTFNDVFMYACFSKTPALSPTGDARPFDAEADGTILGEGLGVLVLKRLADAHRDGDRVYAVIRGIGSSSDGKGNAVYAPSSAGQVRAIRQACQISGMAPETIELMEAHGTGTAVGDAVELQALMEVYGTAARPGPWCALGSVKSQIGHAKAAAGAAGLIKAALALHHQVLPPTIKIERPAGPLASGQSPFYLNTVKRPWLPPKSHPRRAAVSSFGFGGSNFHVILEEDPTQGSEIDWSGRVQIVALSGPDRGRLVAAWKTRPQSATWEDFRLWAAATRRSFDPRHPYRLTMVVERNRSDPDRLMEPILARLADSQNTGNWFNPEGLYLGEGDRPGRLALLFPGQGSQYVGMLRDLACRFPAMRDVLAAADAAWAEDQPCGSDSRLGDLIYPHPAFSDEERAAAEARLTDTRVAQPAIGAVSLGLYRLLELFGVRPDVLAGHSYGELVALCAAGRYQEPDLHRLSRLRGSLMAETNGRPGAMLAIKASAEEAASVIKANDLDLVIANKNAPRQTVLSGPAEEISRAEGAFRQAGLKCVTLKVSNAFHGPLMTRARAPFQEALAHLGFAPAGPPVFANSTAQPYPDTAAMARDLLAGQLTQPVEFIQQIENIYEAGVRTFVEVGPGRNLTGLVQAILEGRTAQALTVDLSQGRRTGLFDLARTLAHLAALGHDLDLTVWDGNPQPRSQERAAPTFTIPISGANQFQPRPLRSTRPTSAPAPVPIPAPSPVPTATPAPRTPALAQTNRPATPPQPEALADAWRLTQANMETLRNFQEKTAELHRLFLVNQEAAHRNLETLLDQQRQLIQASLGLSPDLTAHREPRPAPPLSTTVEAVPQTPARPTATPAPAMPIMALPTPAPEAFPDRASSLDENQVAAVLLELVALQTGYPREMLNLDMGLDADLGIDSIKRVEILSALAERLPGAPTVGSEELGRLQTLRQVVDFLAAPSGQAISQPETGLGADQVAAVLLELVALQTGYPREMLNLDMGLDADLGIDSIKRVEILSALAERLPGAPTVGSEELGRLQTLRQVVDFLAAPSREAISQPGTGLGTDQVAAVLLELVALQTGYPREMLNLDMGLDADLGIDSIKRVEILSALAERLPGAPTVGSEELGRLQTLRQVVDFLAGGAADQAAPSTAAPTGSRPQASESVPEAVTTALLAAVAAETGYPPETLGPDLVLEADLGLDPVRLVEIMGRAAQALGVEPRTADLGRIKTLGQLAACLGEPATAAPPAAGQSPDRYILEARPLDPNRPGALPAPTSGVVVLTRDGNGLADLLANEFRSQGLEPRIVADDNDWAAGPDNLVGLVIIEAETPGDGQAPLKIFQLVQRLGSGLRKNPEAFLATVSRLDGAFGLNFWPRGADPVAGGLAGLAKTVAQEWPEIRTKALDLDRSTPATPEMARAVFEEIMLPGPLEVGLTATGRIYLDIEAAPFAEGPGTEPGAGPIQPGDVVIVTGGARGVTAAAAKALARAWRPTLILWGRSPAPESDPDWAVGLTGEATIKKALFTQAGGTARPKEIESGFRRLMANREMRATIEHLASAGAAVHYFSVDLRDSAATRAALLDVRNRFGPVRGLVHGAGVLADRLMIDKTAEQFVQVYETKIRGLLALLAELPPDELRILALFSSSTGRFGRTGQVDYAMANEVLNKIARREAATRPGCRVAAFNWGPWAGGMVGPGLEKIFAAEGLGLIPLTAGAEFLVRELSQPGPPAVEVVALGPGSPRPESWSPSADPDLAMVGAPRQAWERIESIMQAPYLTSHVIHDRAVLPMAIMIEWLGQAALALDRRSDLIFAGFDQLKVQARLDMDGGEARLVRGYAGPVRRLARGRLVPASLRAGTDKGEVIHAEAEILLTPAAVTGKPELTWPTLQPYPDHPAWYGPGRLFHGPAMQGLSEIQGWGPRHIVGLVQPAPRPEEWMKSPLGPDWLADPLVLDCAFQLVILWGMETHGLPALPVAIGRFRQYGPGLGGQPVLVAAEITAPVTPHIHANVEFLDREGRLLARMDDLHCYASAKLIQAYARNQLKLSLFPSFLETEGLEPESRGAESSGR